MTSQMVNKELQQTYCSISHELKATRQWNIFKKNYAEHETGKLVPDRFLKRFILGKSEWSEAWFHCISIDLKSA